MNILCKFFDAVCEKDFSEGYLIERCAEVDNELSDYVIICTESKAAQLKEWARENLGEKFTMFEKQFLVNSQKAMVFIKVLYKIDSFTSDFVDFVGGKEEFFRLYGEIKQLEKPKEAEEVTQETSIFDDLADEESEVAAEEALGVGEESTEAVVKELMTAIDESVTETKESNESTEVVVDEFTTEESGLLQTEKSVCPRPCIFNTDGSFKGFTEGEIVSMLSLLNELDSRIALDTLNPKYILTANEMKEALPTLDMIAPSVYKAFIMHMVSGCTDETERIRVTVLLDKLSTYINTLSGGILNDFEKGQR